MQKKCLSKKKAKRDVKLKGLQFYLLSLGFVGIKEGSLLLVQWLNGTAKAAKYSETIINHENIKNITLHITRSSLWVLHFDCAKHDFSCGSSTHRAEYLLVSVTKVAENLKLKELITILHCLHLTWDHCIVI